MTNIEAMKLALEALELLARYENPETRIQVRKPKDGGPIVTMYPHKVATDAATVLRTAIEQAEKQEPVAWPCVIAEADFAQNTITVEMQCSDYKVAAGQHWLYTAPPQRKPLKLREIEKCIYDANNDSIVACRNVEAAHGIKENT